jgi:hypothetical protein
MTRPDRTRTAPPLHPDASASSTVEQEGGRPVRPLLFMSALYLGAMIVLSGCATDRPPSGAASLTLPTSAATARGGATSSTSSTGVGAPTSTAAGRPTATLPAYQPATVTDVRSSTVLRSPDPVAKVSAFYVATLERAGWRTITSNLSRASARLIATKGADGVTIAISLARQGSSISVETYRV